MPKSFEDAASEGARRGLRNFLAYFGAHMGKAAAYFVMMVGLIFVALWAIDWMWDGFTSPFRGVWSWTTGTIGGGVDWVTSWLPGGDTLAESVTQLVTEEVVTEVPAEPGIICRNTSGWNWFCN
jgi:hypothetical protein